MVNNIDFDADLLNLLIKIEKEKKMQEEITQKPLFLERPIKKMPFEEEISENNTIEIDL